jgi:hypothetical protein
MPRAPRLAALAVLAGASIAALAPPSAVFAAAPPPPISYEGTHGTKWDYYLNNLEHYSFHHPGTRGHGGFVLASEPNVPVGGKYFLFNPTSGAVLYGLEPDKSHAPIVEVAAWSDVKFDVDFETTMVEVRYGDHRKPTKALVVASASRYGDLADRWEERFEGTGATKEAAQEAAANALHEYENKFGRVCGYNGGSETEWPNSTWTVSYYVSCKAKP